jgi:hypothetical protein
VRAKFKNVERSVCGNIFVFGRYSCWAQNLFMRASIAAKARSGLPRRSLPGA